MMEENWSGPLTDADFDALIEQTKREQARLLAEDVPQVIAEAFTRIFGSGWMTVEAIAEKYAENVADTRAQLSAIAEAANADFAAARAAGFPERWPVLH